ncbi:SDR family oxidoreductase [Phototrophicus methaneseepsis]|uniref:SDR family oxidoreductase n=1 Tax=Phototrophicus methaneseepsis TaxID=2710758 RepID=A0A7S8IE89_9CHLR|nr:SDR family oxidoreductase [Phototrophicus methaneseepsis]QPC82184.1 SDR family oxidoreductase [Phototrophicus methaneseepsis]
MADDTVNKQKTILVTGATGYIGGRLIPHLLKSGYRVRVMSRNVRHLQGRSWQNKVDVVEADVLRPDTLATALEGVDIAYYLIHSISARANFAQRDAQAANNFGNAAKQASVDQIIYLGGLGQERDGLSDHLASRQEVGAILKQHVPNTTEFRAAMVIGAGSLSFEMMRYLTQRLPIMLCPSWLYTRTQPIAVRDVLSYLVAAAATPASKGEIIEIGGQDILTYRDMMARFARLRGLRRYMIPMPVLAPHFSGLWVHLTTPISYDIAQPLINSLSNEMVVTDNKAHRIFTGISPLSTEEALLRALDELDAQEVETTWTDSMAATWVTDEPYTFIEERGMFIEARNRTVKATPEKIFSTFSAIGGQQGWLYLDWLWRARGYMDRFVGGPGYRFGRRNPASLRVGDVLDFWRVEAIDPNRMLLLRAEMRLPGRGWLRFAIEPHKDGTSTLTQTAYYAPKGLFGFIYWYALFIAHKFIFDGMINQLVSLSESEEQEPASTQPSRRLYLAGVSASLTVALAIIAAAIINRRDNT